VIAAGRRTEINDIVSAARARWGERGEVVFDSGLAYFEGEPITIRLRKRGHRYHLDDQGGAIRVAGRPRGWLEASEHVVAREGFNINRRGVIFVSVGEGRDLASLVLRLAELSVDVSWALLDLRDRS
jgi:hypothetical protein